jgi:AcrR family transcriptional regulator
MSRGELADKVERKARVLDRAAATAEQAAAKLAAKAAQIDEVSARLAALDLWTRPEPGARRPRFTRDDIARAALHIADGEGFDALSMRRLASELDAGTMTLYHYVRTKDELLVLLLDAVMAELIVPDGELPADWRAALMTIARRSRDALTRHPWTLDIREDPAPGPNGVRHFDQSMQAVAGLDVPLADRVELITAVDEYVFGHCLFERQNEAAAEVGGEQGMLDYVEGLIDSGGYPALAAMRDGVGLDRLWHDIEQAMHRPDRFERNLGRLLDGFEASFRAGRHPR